MKRPVALFVAFATASLLAVGCSGSDEEPGGITRIDGPAQVDDDVRVDPGDSSEG